MLQQSDTEAYLWARKAALAGLAKAEYAMGYFTEVGIGATANMDDAKRWYWRASCKLGTVSGVTRMSLNLLFASTKLSQSPRTFRRPPQRRRTDTEIAGVPFGCQQAIGRRLQRDVNAFWAFWRHWCRRISNLAGELGHARAMIDSKGRFRSCGISLPVAWISRL